MLRVDAKQGAPKDGNAPLELFQVTLVVYPSLYHILFDIEAAHLGLVR